MFRIQELKYSSYSDTYKWVWSTWHRSVEDLETWMQHFDKIPEFRVLE